MPSLFGEYLVEKKYINNDQLLKALLIQLTETPPIAKVVLESKILDTQQTLACLKEQALSSCSFIDAAKKQGVWNSSYDEKIRLELQSKRSPLGEILVRESVIEINALTRALDEYFSETKKATPIETKPSAAPTPAAVQPVTSSNSDSTLSGDVVAYFNQSLFQSMEKVMAAFRDKSVGHLADSQELINQIHQIVGAAKLFGAGELSILTEELEKIIRTITTRKKDKIGLDHFEKAKLIIEFSITLFKELIADNEKEPIQLTAFTAGKYKDKFKDIHDRIFVLDFDLSHIEAEK